MRKIVIGVMGPGEGATPQDCELAYQLGGAIAAAGWVLLTGGRNQGVMDAASRGARDKGGLTVGLLPGADQQNVSEAVDIVLCTGMGSARNNINVLSSNVVVACGMGTGTASEVALALKARKPVILLNVNTESVAFFTTLSEGRVAIASSVESVIQLITAILTLKS